MALLEPLGYSVQVKVLKSRQQHVAQVAAVEQVTFPVAHEARNEFIVTVAPVKLPVEQTLAIVEVVGGVILTVMRTRLSKVDASAPAFLCRMLIIWGSIETDMLGCWLPTKPTVSPALKVTERGRASKNKLIQKKS